MKRAGLGAIALWTTALTGACALAQAPGSQADDAAILKTGRALYLGLQPFAGPVGMGTVVLSAAAITGGCASCHGRRGEGGREGGVAVPAIQWQTLQQFRAGRRPFDGEQAVVNAIRHGAGREGSALRTPMPQFSMTDAEQQALVTWLRVLGTEGEPRPGLYGDRIVLGTVVPLTGARARVGEHIRTRLASRFDAVNRSGGLFGRRIELRVADAGSSLASAVNAARNMVASGQVIALVGSVVTETDTALLQTISDNGVPMVATLGVPAGDSPAHGINYLLPSLHNQVSSLATELERHCVPRAGTAKTLVLHESNAPIKTEAIDAQVKVIDRPGSLDFRTVRNPSELPRLLAQGRAPRVIAVLPPVWVGEVRRLMASSQTVACLGTLAIASGSQFDGVASELIEAVALPMPLVNLRADAESSETLWTLLADVAANTMIEALSRSGRNLDGAALLVAIESLKQFEAAPGVTVTFSPRRRHGFEVSTLLKERNHAGNNPRQP